jgi:hypothetical protein
MKRYGRLLIIIMLASLVLTGCIGVNGGFRNIRNHILNNMSANYEKEIEFSVGSGGIFLASMFIGFADIEENVDDMLRQISSVQIGIYKNESGEVIKNDFSVLKSLSDKMEEKGWTFIVRSIDNDELAAVFVNNNSEDELTQVFVVALHDEELVLAEIHGDLGDLIDIAIREHGLNFEIAENH